jgi:hypothetical protein
MAGRNLAGRGRISAGGLVLVFALALCLLEIVAAGDSPSQIKKRTNISAQPLGAALQALARDRDFQIVYVSEVVNVLRSHGAVGDLTSQEALQQLLHGTGLTFRYLDDETVMIEPDCAPNAPSRKP